MNNHSRKGSVRIPFGITALLPGTIALAGSLALAACAPHPPTAPNVMVLPQPGKSLTQFQQEDTSCRQYANQQVAYVSPSQPAKNTSVDSTLVATGLYFGAAAEANSAQATASNVQQRYDVAYIKCITGHGNRLARAPFQLLPNAPVAYSPEPVAYAYYPPVLYGGGVVVIGAHRTWR